MATFYVTRPAHVTYYKYEVEAATLEEAKAIFDEDGDAADCVQYVGYLDGDWDSDEPDVWSEDDSYVEGHG